MSKRFFTSDWHLCSPGIIQCAHRPFKTTEQMNKRIIQLANSKAKDKTDVIIHLGDFIQYNKDKHYEDKRCVGGEKIKPKEFINQLNASFINIEGNHDPSNKMKSFCKFIKDFNIGSFEDASIGHYPSHMEEAKGQFTSHKFKKDWTIRLCGHVHQWWKYYFDEENRILNINVGLDAWKGNIVSEDEIIKYVNKIENNINERFPFKFSVILKYLFVKKEGKKDDESND